jgi:hypothetical protein
VRHHPQQPQQPPQPPNVQITFPPPGSVICGTVTVRATATSPAGIHDVAFAYSLDGGNTWTDFGTDTSGPPYTVLFDTTTVPDGPIQIRALATANNGLTAFDIRSYVVDNTPPAVAITSPANNAIVSGTITVTGVAADSDLSFVEWLVDGTLAATQTTPPFALTLDTTTLAGGPHTITMRACDTCPNCAETAITIIVRNVPAPPQTQVGVDDAMCIPAPKPPAEEIVSHRTEITVERVWVIGTPLGTKVVVSGKVCVLLTYSADVPDQRVHAVEACFPFHTFMLAPDLAPEARVSVTTDLEFEEFNLLDPCTIGKFILFRVTATPF